MKEVEYKPVITAIMETENIEMTNQVEQLDIILGVNDIKIEEDQNPPI